MARIYLLMASCCAMPAPTFAIQPAAASCQEHLPYCHINLDVWGDRWWGSYEYGIAGRQYDAVDRVLQCSLIDLCWRSPCKRVASSLYIADGVIMQQALPNPISLFFATFPLFVRIVCRPRRNSAARASRPVYEHCTSPSTASKNSPWNSALQND